MILILVVAPEVKEIILIFFLDISLLYDFVQNNKTTNVEYDV